MTDDRLRELERAWQTSGASQDEHAYLSEKVRSGQARYVFLDPDGSFAPWAGVVVRHPTGVVYGNQCRGTATEERLVEGYFIPLGGATYPDSDRFDRSGLTSPFHRGGGCDYTATGATLSSDDLGALRQAVESLACWRTALQGSDERLSLRLDEDQLAELVEAWVPVITPHGRGVLVYTNCD